ncbi:M20 family metallo-hydrolase [Nonomuraea aridisoli]|uniref:Zn-dependent hydrolase n=1 Tax=Nonomuraea aridisoli TaxID=2070368 RepID=A0A2W2F7Z0_9ACTN|nr:M20 family metallo-hydrolase [Nonomuraea aridisoli]PZG21740.1 Zn-dependent hydrolase [Nonomuraea aridisoli]
MNIDIDPQKMARYVEELGRLGELPDGGMARFQYDVAWAQAQDLVAGWMREAGLRVRRDAVGNVFGRLPGADDSATILTGSHIDTVPEGGKYDGALGVLAGLAALEALAALGERPRTSLEVVSLCEEESSRYQANFFGSRAMLGLVGPDEPATLKDADGVSMAEAMTAVGLDPSAVATAKRDDVAAFVELHIEQGKVLETAGTDVGIVEVITGLVWEEIVVTGRQDHAGGTPMDARLDAVQAAAEISTAITRHVAETDKAGRVTFGRWDVRPGWPSIVPGEVVLSMDLRHTVAEDLKARADEVHRIAATIAARRGVEITFERLKDETPTVMDTRLREALTQAAADCGATSMDLPSGAGHDSQLMGEHVPTAMLFVPSVEGRSHCKEEYTHPEDCVRGASVLATALHRMAF